MKNRQLNEVREYSAESNTAYIRRYKGNEVEVYKKVYGSSQFWRVWLGDLLQALGLVSNSKQLDVVIHVFENTDPASNLYISTFRKTMADTGVSFQTVALIFKKMQEQNIITKVQNGVYQVNPQLMMKGNDHKKRKLTIEYEQLATDDEDGEE